MQITENLGTNNLGNPGRLWFYPCGSADYRVWLVELGGYTSEVGTGKAKHVPPSGYLVHQSRHGRSTTTDWVLPLAVGGNDAVATGTLSKIVKAHHLRISGPISATQLRFLAQKHPYIAMSPGRGENEGIFTWYVSPSSTYSRGYWMCVPEPITEPGGGIAIDINRVLYASPILPEEAQAMGIQTDQLWHGPGKFKAQYETDFSGYDFSS